MNAKKGIRTCVCACVRERKGEKRVRKKCIEQCKPHVIRVNLLIDYKTMKNEKNPKAFCSRFI